SAADFNHGVAGVVWFGGAWAATGCVADSAWRRRSGAGKEQMLRLIVQRCIFQPDVGDLVLAPDIGKRKISGRDLWLLKDDLLFSEASGAFCIEVVDG